MVNKVKLWVLGLESHCAATRSRTDSYELTNSIALPHLSSTFELTLNILLLLFLR